MGEKRRPTKERRPKDSFSRVFFCGLLSPSRPRRLPTCLSWTQGHRESSPRMNFLCQVGVSPQALQSSHVNRSYFESSTLSDISVKNLLVFTSCCPLSAQDPTSNDRSGSSFIHTARNDPVELDVWSYSFSKLNVGG